MYLTHDDDKGCSLNFEFTGNGVLFNTGVYFTYCNIKLGGQSATTVYNSSDSSYAAFEKCYVSGEMPFQRWNFRGYDNIFDIEIHSDTQIINNQGSLNQWITNVLNSDKMHGEYNRPDYNSIFLQATTEQLSDAAYLQSIGFSIAAG